MCGIIAYLCLDGAVVDTRAIENSLEKGLKRIEHRGPDGLGVWLDPGNRCGLAHCRLSINDLSSSGAQPLHSPSGVHAIVNGEIYDDGTLRRSVDYSFTGHSDSELVLALYEKHGIDFLNHLRGEFALVLYDERLDLFMVARDRYGVKPMFWRREGGVAWFAAEIKAFLDGRWVPQWDVGAIVDGGWGQDTRTLFRGVQKSDVDSRSPVEIISSLRSHLLDSVRLRLRADVPVGIYLSGGIDSSALAGIASHLVKEEGMAMGSQDPKKRVCCFSIGFDAESGFDESEIAKRTAQFLNVKFIKTHMTEASLADAFEDATYHIEHHNQDLNYIGKYALSSVPRENGYKVVLTGEGADEQFGGYPLYLPDFLREQDGYEPDHSLIDRETLVVEQEAVVKQSYEMIGADSRYFEESRVGGLTTPSALSAFTPSPHLFTSTRHQSPLRTIYNNIPPHVHSLIQSSWHPLNSAMYVWSKGHLANQFLSCLGDRVEMAHSVEARTPFLDHVLAEYINHIPPSLKIRTTKIDGEKVYVEKYALREAVKPFVTEEVYTRRKHAYSAPTTYPRDGPIHQLLLRVITEGNVARLGFVKVRAALDLLSTAFGEEGEVSSRTWAFRQCLMTAQWIIISQRFGVMTAR